MADYFQKILEKLEEDLAGLGTPSPASATPPAQTQPLTCAEADKLFEEWYSSAAEYRFQFDSYPHFRALSQHLSEQNGCTRCRSLYTDLAKVDAQASYALLQKLTATARLILAHSLSATSSLEIWSFLLAHPYEHPSYSLPAVALSAQVSLKPRLILPDPEVEPDDLPPTAGFATLSLALTASGRNFDKSSLTVVLYDAAGNSLWSGQSGLFSREGRARLTNLPLEALYQTAAIFWALHLPEVLPPAPLLKPRPAVFMQIGFSAQELVSPLQKLRELYHNASDLENAMSGTRQLNETDLANPATNGGAEIELSQPAWAAQDVTLRLLAFPHPTQADRYDLQVRILDITQTPPQPDKRRWIVQIEPDLLEKETQTGQVTFENLKLPGANSASLPGHQWQLFLWLQG